MTYFDRLRQLKRTLRSIRRSTHKNYEIVIVDDANPTPLQLTNKKIHIVRVEPEEKNWYNPVIVYNKAIQKALELNPEIIILQNPESYHVGDILTYANENSNENNYISFSCLNLTKEITFGKEFSDEFLIDLASRNQNKILEDHIAWLNHPVYNKNPYDYCSVISPTNLIKLNGYDERFADGITSGDDDLLFRIRNLKLKVETPQIEKSFVVHQWHPREAVENFKELAHKNFILFYTIQRNEPIKYKAIHTHSPNFS